MRPIILSIHRSLTEARLPLSFEDARTCCHLDTCGTLTIQDKLLEVEFHPVIKALSHRTFDRYYSSLHHCRVEQLRLLTEQGPELVLERERIVSWSGQGGSLPPETIRLHDLGLLLSQQYRLAFESAPGEEEMVRGEPLDRVVRHGTAPGT